MDLNYLHHREGVERMRADDARCRESRLVHLALAGMFRDRIEDMRHARIAAAAL